MLRRYGLITPSANDTAGIQALVNAQAGLGEIVLPAGTWNVAGLTIPSGGIAIRGEYPGGTVLNLVANAPAFYGSAISAPIVIRDLTVTGSAPNWNGATVNISDLGQAAVHLIDCSNVRLDNVAARNISGSAFDIEHPSSGFNIASDLMFSNLSVWNSYRAYRTRNSAEYATFTGCRARSNIFAAMIESGNITFTGFSFCYNYSSIQIIGRANPNPAHATFSSGKSNHAFYALDMISCGTGSSFTGVDFVGDPGGSLNAGGEIRIANCKGVNISGGQLGSNVTVLQADPSGGSVALAGANTIQGAFVRDDIPGFVVPTCDYAGGLLKKQNFNAAGAWSQNTP